LTRERRLTLVACILGTGMVFLDGTVMNVALPAIQEDLDANLAEQQWVVESFLLTLSSLLLVGGSLDDILERRTVFAAGVAGFGVTSLLCALAPSVEVLIVARGLQGVTGALLVPSTLAIIMAVFPPEERGAAIGSWTAWAGIFTVMGPLGGGALIDLASWRWIFVINLPFVLITLWLIRRAIPRMESAEPGAKIDFLGALLCCAGLGGIIVALIEQPTRGWDDPLVAIGGVGGVIAFAAFLLHERRAPNPMLPLELFRSRNFAIGNIGTLTLYAGLGGAMFFVALYLQQVGGYSAVEAGAAFLPFTFLMFFLSKRMGALADRIGPRLFMGLGPIVAGIGLLLLLRMDTTPDYASEVLPGVMVFGLGMAATVAPLTATVLGAVDQRHSGVASGVNNAVSRVAGLLAIAVLGAAVATSYSSAVDDELRGRELSGAGQAAVAEAKTRPLAVEPADAAPPAEREELRAAFASASESAFRYGVGLGAILVLAGGVVSLLGITNARRDVPCRECPGGAAVGAPEEIAHPAPDREPVAA
jgi:EmrB/QacA subfamily drug resistance transporter